jgi:perosamine synthetase
LIHVVASVNKYFKKLVWYPPAETKISLSALFKAFLSGRGSFEKTLCEYLNVENCVLANSARALLYQLLKVLNENTAHSRNEVLVPGYACYSVAAAVAKANLKIRAYDLDPKTLAPDFDSIKKCVNNKTLAIISQHLFGIPTPVEELHVISMNSGAYHIEDAAQAFSGMSENMPVGAHGDFGLYSFGRGKPLPIGCGGALIGKDKKLLGKLKLDRSSSGHIDLLKILITHIMASKAFYWIAETLPLGLGDTVFDKDFKTSTIPIKVNIFAEKSMAILEELNEHRKQISKLYNTAFNEDFLIPVNNNDSAVYTRFPLIVDSKPVKKELIRLGVRRMYPKALVEEKTIKPYIVNVQETTPGSSEIAERLITFPTHKGISVDFANEIIQMVKDQYAC